ncbi:MAG: hypothetical protein RMJ33_05870 [Saprospiraceae bacterium]|nr:hypothetical protein [Saprospiraceae bacterium]MDW8229346.1 hypothetical protein [Saprospiraceae bacterium]
MLKHTLLFLAWLAASAPTWAQLSGVYTIGGADGQFANLTQAAQTLKSGSVSGPVVSRCCLRQTVRR